MVREFRFRSIGLGMLAAMCIAMLPAAAAHADDAELISIVALAQSEAAIDYPFDMIDVAPDAEAFPSEGAIIASDRGAASLGGAIREAERRPGLYGLKQHVTFVGSPVPHYMLC